MVNVQWIEGELGVQLVHLLEEVPNVAVLDLRGVMQEEKPDTRVAADEGRHEPLVKLVDALQVHVWRDPDVLIYQIQRCVGHKLRQVAVVKVVVAAFGAVLQLEEWIIRLADDDEVVGVSGAHLKQWRFFWCTRSAGGEDKMEKKVDNCQ
ncbi:hypothetical protein TYRP_001955 [Tyrophagus putrescentiae]|nr:hypothetical protein TYRP_001955 [Tyrophagus putrescentiae]